MINMSDINKIIEKQLYDVCLYLAKKGGRSFFIGKDIKWVNTTPSTWPNFIFDSNFKADELNDRVREINAEIETLVVPPLWIVSTNEQTGPLTTALEENGLRLSAQWTGIAMDLAPFQASPLPEGLVIHSVNDLTLLGEWCTVASKYLFNSSPLDVDLFAKFLNDEHIKMYLGKYNGIPVSTLLMYLSGDVAGLYMGTTSSEYRNKGFGSAILSFPMMEAKKMNYRITIGQATAMGLRTWKKLGFDTFKEYRIFWKVGKKYKL